MNTIQEKNKKIIRSVMHGFICMIIACGVYLIWWFINYYPDSPYSHFIGNTVGMAIWGAMFAAVFALCAIAVVLMTKSFRSLETGRGILKMKHVFYLCLIASVLLPLLIHFIRFITLDIFLIIWWAFLELFTANIMYASELMQKNTSQHSMIRTCIYTIVSLVIYIIYPFPSQYVRFILGAVPIFLYALDMSWMVRQMKEIANA